MNQTLRARIARLVRQSGGIAEWDFADEIIRIATESLFQAISHGDEEHRSWLKDAIEAHFAGHPTPAVRGSGNKEARIAELEKQLAEIRRAA